MSVLELLAAYYSSSFAAPLFLELVTGYGCIICASKNRLLSSIAEVLMADPVPGFYRSIEV